MGLSGGHACIKWLMFLFNLLFFLMGGAILGIGIWLKVEKRIYEGITSYDYVTPANLGIVVGVVMLFISFLGCFGAIKELRHMLLGYFILLLIILIFELAIGGVAYAKRDEIEGKLSDDFKIAIQDKYGNPDFPEVTKVIDKFQNEFQCCGFDNLTDYEHSFYLTVSKYPPKSCCVESQKDEPTCGNSYDPKIYDQKGCYNEVVRFLKYNLLVFGTFAIIFAIIQITGLAFSMVLYCAIARKERRGTYA